MEEIKRLWPEVQKFDLDILEQMAINAQYKGYLDRQKADIKDFRKDEALILPENLDRRSRWVDYQMKSVKN